VAYNDYIVEQQLNVGYKMAAFNEAIANVENGLEDVKVFHTELLDQAKVAVANVKGMNGYAGNTALRDAALALYSFYVDIIADEYYEMMEIVVNPAPTEAQMVRVQELLEQITAEEQGFDQTYQKAQEDFAKAHNFTLSEPEDPFEDE
jgi:hypothetical protein